MINMNVLENIDTNRPAQNTHTHSTSSNPKPDGQSQIQRCETTKLQSKGFWLASWAFSMQNNSPQQRRMMLCAWERQTDRHRARVDIETQLPTVELCCTLDRRAKEALWHRHSFSTSWAWSLLQISVSSNYASVRFYLMLQIDIYCVTEEL